ncbi:MAG TPA: hypothetical protein DGT23_06870 [Micromonosporaceae bacterium]|nr:hypothetical protein [Micromonosporaceae bacterium]
MWTVVAKKQIASPLAAGGAGTLYEYRVAAILLTHLLAGSHPPGLLVPVHRVGLQQRVRGYYLDDVVVFGEPGSTSTEFQIKRTLKVTAKDKPFGEAVSQALYSLDERAGEISAGEHGLGLIALGDVTALDQLSDLTIWAASHKELETFAQFMTTSSVDVKLRRRLGHVQRAVAEAIKHGAPAQGSVEETTHRLLAALTVWCVAQADGQSDHRSALDRLQPIADKYGQSPSTMFAHLATLAETWGPRGGVADKEMVQRHLRRLGLREPAPSMINPPVDALNVDGVVRGPVEALDLSTDLAEAESRLASADEAAIELFDRIAQKLAASHFHPHATVMLRKRATALQRLGRVDEAVMARAGIAWSELDFVRPWEAGFAMADGDSGGDLTALDPQTHRVRKTVAAAISVAKGASLDTFIDAFDIMQDDDPYRTRAALFLCEEAIAADRLQTIVERLDLLRPLADQSLREAKRDTERTGAVRLSMCLADATGEWDALIRTINLRQPRKLVAWAQARHGRYLALAGDGEAAKQEYLQAIERATEANLYSEASDWLYALRTVRFWHYTPSASSDDLHARAQALWPLAGPKTLPGSPYTKELALEAMLDETSPHEAIQRVRRWLWQVTIQASLADEMAAARALGRLLQRQEDYLPAIEAFVRAGEEKLAKAASSAAPDQALQIQAVRRSLHKHTLWPCQRWRKQQTCYQTPKHMPGQRSPWKTAKKLAPQISGGARTSTFQH